MSIFDSLKKYATKWNVKATRKFTQEEIDSVDEAVVVPSEFGNSVCFTLKAGGKTYIPLDRDATITVGEYVKLEDCEIVTLCKPGENDINRIKI